MTYLIITPIKEELELLSKYLMQEDYMANNKVIGRLPTIEFPELDLILAQGGLGKTQFGLQTQHLLDNCTSVNAVICAGAAGALANYLQIGDIVIASETVEHDCIYRFVNRSALRFPGDKHLIGQFGKLKKESTKFVINIGVMASGDEDIVERSRAEEISTQTGAIAVAWEGAGGARACKFSEVSYLELRGITDTANHEASNVFDKNLVQVMDNIGWMIKVWLGNKKAN